MNWKTSAFILLFIVTNIKLCYNNPVPYTYAASIRVDSKPICVGMILTTTWIVTLCDCVSRTQETPSRVTVRVGLISSEARIEEAREVICHKAYKSNLKTPDVDLALLRFRSNGIILGDSVRKGLLPLTPLVRINQTKTVYIKEVIKPSNNARNILVGWTKDMNYYTMRTDPGWRLWVEQGLVGKASDCQKFKEWRSSMICAVFFYSQAKSCDDGGRITIPSVRKTQFYTYGRRPYQTKKKNRCLLKMHGLILSLIQSLVVPHKTSVNMQRKNYTFILLLVIINTENCYSDANKPLPYAYSASIRVDSRPVCVGMILTTTWILTLCDCVSSMKTTPLRVTVRVGILSNEARIEEAREIICHDAFKSNFRTPDENLALLRIRNKGIILGSSVRKGFLPIIRANNADRKIAKEPTNKANVILVGWMKDTFYSTMKTDLGWRTWITHGQVGKATDCKKFKEWRSSMICGVFVHPKADNCEGRGTLMVYNRSVWGLMNYKNARCGGFHYFVPYVKLGQESNLEFIVGTIQKRAKPQS
ncbi:hypothetical protein ILUMI_01703 [Ignelater luminosus]|uniref:Peptidase S1 domain-containing protein n=1 Tax=Ignelater luminosus TaxID=2038154 RepID=A0A8K0DE21_IGNLU|nr:hypothetical protein ILUMI_01703 [Ignelater luminosus]